MGHQGVGLSEEQLLAQLLADLAPGNQR